jgi:hypothetical protein
MTPVRFKFLTPTGVPIANHPFYVSLNKAAFHNAHDGFVHPEVIESLTDDQGEALLPLFPVNKPYYVSMDATAEVNDEQCSAALRFRIAVPDVVEELWANDLVITDPIFSQAWDAEAIEVIMAAKASAAASASAAKSSEIAADASATAAAASELTASTAATNAAASELAAAGSATAADLSASAAGASQAAAALSEQSASASANLALSSANTAVLAAAEAKASETASAGSAATAGGHATAAAASKDAAASSAAASSASADAAKLAETGSVAAKTAAELARDQSVAAAGSVSGVISDLGAWSASTGVYPAKPALGSAFWKVTTNGTVDGIQYGIGDTLMYSKNLDEYYKIDNTESVSSVNGKTGVVVLTKTDVGLNIGIGEYNTISTVDCNAITIPGSIVSTAANSSNLPIPALGYLRVVAGASATYVSQHWTEFQGPDNGRTPRSWIRNLNGGVWTPWALSITGSNWLPLTANVSADTLTEANVTYHVQGATVTELPLASTGFLRVLFRGDAGGAALRCVQEFTPYEPANGSSRTWRRSRSETNVWTAWFRTDTGALGTAAQGTLTTGVTDNTPGRVLKTGDFGVGSIAVTIDESVVNAVAATGFYYVAGSGLGVLPVNTNGYLHHHCVTTGFNRQTFREYNNTNVWERAMTNGAWGGWTQSIDSNAFVIRTGSVMADMNILSVTGVYNTAENTVGSPLTAQGLLFHQQHGNPDYANQEWTHIATGEKYARVKQNGTWGLWRHIISYADTSLDIAVNLNFESNRTMAVNDTTLNRPNWIAYGFVTTWWRNTSEAIQFVHSVTNAQAAVRRMISGSWTPWINTTPAGHDQTWINVTGGRTWSTWYPNDTVRELKIKVLVGPVSMLNSYISMDIENSQVAGTSRTLPGVYAGAAGQYITMDIVVPSGWNYKLNYGNDPGAIYNWFEYR